MYPTTPKKTNQHTRKPTIGIDSYEDDDVEELNKEEAAGCLALYQTLKAKFSEAKGSPVPQEDEDEAAEGGDEGGGGADASKNSKEKEKGKGKVKRTPIRGGDLEAQIAVLGRRVRKSFSKLDEEYDGTVSSEGIWEGRRARAGGGGGKV